MSFFIFLYCCTGLLVCQVTSDILYHVHFYFFDPRMNIMYSPANAPKELPVLPPTIPKRINPIAELYDIFSGEILVFLFTIIVVCIVVVLIRTMIIISRKFLVYLVYLVKTIYIKSKS